MNCKQLSELNRLCDAATPGPWQWCEVGEKYYHFAMGQFARLDSDEPLPPGHVDPATAFLNEPVAEAEHQGGGADFAFICAARTAVPDLITENVKLRVEVKRLKELVRAAFREGWNDGFVEGEARDAVSTSETEDWEESNAHRTLRGEGEEVE